ALPGARMAATSGWRMYFSNVSIMRWLIWSSHAVTAGNVVGVPDAGEGHFAAPENPVSAMSASGEKHLPVMPALDLPAVPVTWPFASDDPLTVVQSTVAAIFPPSWLLKQPANVLNVVLASLLPFFWIVARHEASAFVKLAALAFPAATTTSAIAAKHARALRT